MSDDSPNQSYNQSSPQNQVIAQGKKIAKKKKRKQNKSHKMISSTYQKKRCQFFNRGACQKGRQCTFSHSFVPDFAKKICKFYLSNSCAKGESCPYSHNTKRYPCKFYHIQKLCNQGDSCRFSHEQIDPDFEEQFLKDNQQLLVKLYKTNKLQDHKLITYVQSNNLLQKIEKDKKSEPAEQLKINIPFIFGFPIGKISQKKQQSSVHQKKQNSQQFAVSQRSQNINELPQNRSVKVKVNDVPKDPRLLLRKKSDKSVKGIFAVKLQTRNRYQLPQNLQQYRIPKQNSVSQPIYHKNIDKTQLKCILINQGDTIDIFKDGNLTATKYRQCQPHKQHPQQQQQISRLFSDDLQNLSQQINQQIQLTPEQNYGAPRNIYNELEYFMCSYY